MYVLDGGASYIDSNRLEAVIASANDLSINAVPLAKKPILASTFLR